MSISHISAVLDLPPTVNGTTRMVAIVLAEHAGRDTDECWPSVATIRREAGLRQDKAVQKAIGELVALGLVEVEANGMPDSRVRNDRRPNLYRLIGTLARAGLVAADDPPRGGVNRPPVARTGGARRAATGGRVAPSAPHIEPVLEPELSPAAPSRPTDDPVRHRAHELATLAHEQSVKPVTRGGFVTVMDRIEEQLRAGCTVGDIRRAIESGEITWTRDGLQTAISKARPQRSRDDTISKARSAMDKLEGGMLPDE